MTGSWPELLAGDEVLSTAILIVCRITPTCSTLKEGATDAETSNPHWPAPRPEIGAFAQAGQPETNQPPRPPIRNFICRLIPQLLVSLDRYHRARVYERMSAAPKPKLSELYAV